MADTATLQNMGQAGFFGGIIAMLLPPSLALALFVITSGTLLLGMVFGWAWGVAAMVSALHVRDKALLASRLVAAQKAAIAAASSGVPAQAEVRHHMSRFLAADLTPRRSSPSPFTVSSSIHAPPRSMAHFSSSGHS
jgi:hypothetical protein